MDDSFLHLRPTKASYASDNPDAGSAIAAQTEWLPISVAEAKRVLEWWSASSAFANLSPPTRSEQKWSIA